MSNEHLIDALDHVETWLKVAEESQRVTSPTEHGDFYAWGSTFAELTYRLAGVGRTLHEQVESYEQGRRLRDDEGARPGDRLSRACGELAQLVGLLDAAHQRAAAYHSAIGHIGVEYDPTDDPEAAKVGDGRGDHS